MYCVKCGVKLADTEKICPLCATRAYHPDLHREDVPPTYPMHKYPPIRKRSKAFNGAILFLFLLPILLCVVIDWQSGNGLTWSGYVAGALVLGYIVFALPLWFVKVNPIIFVPCDFAAVAAFVLYVALATGGTWYLGFALPIIGTYALISSAVATLLYCLKRGRLYIWGGAFMAFGASMLLIEFLMTLTFAFPYIGWSLYPLLVFCMLGGLLIYLAINRSAREVMERKFFF